MNEWMNGWMNKWMDELMDGWMDVRINDALVNEWMDM
jgi:hypothetical protein